MRVNTAEAAVSDMQRDLDRGIVPENKLENVNLRIEKLGAFVEKYKAILAESDENTDYAQLADQLGSELDKIHEEINS